jgi:hypothetical protein
MASPRDFLHAVVDYAGLFPPASLSMDDAVRAYARFLEGPESDLLARFVLPMSRLDEFSVTAAPFLPRGESTEPWRLSVIGGNDAAAARDAALSFNCSHWNGSDKGHAVCDAIELQVKDAESVQNVVDAVPDFFQLFLEVPAAGDPERLIAAMAHTRAAAKIRTGGVTPEAIPSSQSVLHFMKSCRHYGVPFKATAGLHHAVRAIYPLTYEQGAPVAEMFGYLNVFLAAAAVNEGASDEIALGILEERDASRFVFDDSGLTWRDFKIGADRLMLARAGFARSFGSCSFTEPVQEGKELGLV